VRLRPVRSASLLLGIAFAASCRGHGADPGPLPALDPAAAATDLRCEPALPEPASLVDVGALAGPFRLVLVAGTGPAAGATASGTLELVATDSAAAPFRGWTDVPAERLGATVPGDAGSRAKEAPGVRVLVGPAGPGPDSPSPITVRLGSHANREGPPLFDEAYAVLLVETIGPGGFSGRWASGLRGPDVEGHFCAVAKREAGPS